MSLLTKTEDFEYVLGFTLKRLPFRKIPRADRLLIWGFVELNDDGMTISGGDLIECPSSGLNGSIFQGEPVLIDLQGAKICRVSKKHPNFPMRKSKDNKMLLSLSNGSVFSLRTNCIKMNSNWSFGRNKIIKSNYATDRWISILVNLAHLCYFRSREKTERYFSNTRRLFSSLPVTIGDDGTIVSYIFNN
jgi:hypothetical protein